MDCPKKIPKTFCCNNCNYFTCNSKDYNKHLSTAKHKSNVNLNILEQKIPTQHDGLFNCICGKTYTARNSLWYHKQKCRQNADTFNTHKPQDVQPRDELIEQLVNSNTEIKEENREMKYIGYDDVRKIPKIGNGT